MDNSIVKQKKLLQFLRTSTIYADKATAKSALQSLISSSFGDASADGTPVLARYYDEDNNLKTLMGVCYDTKKGFSITIFDDGTDFYKEFQTRLDELMQAVGLTYEGDVITFVADTECVFASGATSVNEAITKLDKALSSISGMIAENKYSIESVEPATEGSWATYQLVDEFGVRHGETIEIPFDKYLSSASLVEKGGEYYLELVFVVEGGKTETVDLPIKELIDLTDVASDHEVRAVEKTIGGEYDESTSAYTIVFSGESVSSSTRVVDAIDALDDEIKKLKAKTIGGDEPIYVNTDKDGNSTVGLNYIATSDTQNAGLMLTAEDEVNKLDVSFDFGLFELLVVYASTADDVEEIEDKASATVIIATSDALAAATNYTFKSISLTTDVETTTENPTVKLTATDNIVVDGVNINGELQPRGGVIVYSTPEISVKNVTVEDGAQLYNVFEGIQSGTKLEKLEASNITVDNVSLKHNVFNVYLPENDAEITIKDSDFNLDVNNSNILRLANYSNATGVTVTFENVNWTYENSPVLSPSSIAWAGLIIVQPASKDIALPSSYDMSAYQTWTFNFINCKYNGQTVSLDDFGTVKQIMYFYNVGSTGAITDPRNYNLTINIENS